MGDVPRKNASWGVITMLAAAQFIMILDSTVMNVSITTIVKDLNTTVLGLQTAITAYTLVMAAFMLIGGKLGDRWGAKRAFVAGLLVYGVGALTTSLAPSLAVLLVGWSIVEGLGAVLVIPAIASLTAATYQGKQRAMAYGILGGVAGASAAAGPLIGGWVTATYSWRYVFGGEAVVVLALMLFLRLIPKTQGRTLKLDTLGAVLSASGLALAVFGVLRSSQWGWIMPTESVPVIRGVTIAPLGLSPVLWLIIAGGFLITLFVRHEERTKAAGAEPLLDLALLKIWPLRAGLIVLFCQQFIIMGTFFVIPLYLQTVLGFNAFQTGITVMPLSVALFFFALSGSALTGRFRPKSMLQVGIGLMLVGEALLLYFTSPNLDKPGFSVALALVGAGLGLLGSQLGNIIMSSVSSDRGGEAGGLQGTMQNLGASLGTALVGSILIAALASSFQSGIVGNPQLPSNVQQEVLAAAKKDANFVSAAVLSTGAEKAGLSSTEVDTIVSGYKASQIKALKTSFAAIALFALLALLYVRRLPTDHTIEAADTKPAT